MVYDCGEIFGPKKITHLIDEYTNKLGNSKIDMLVASHLHSDHVCGFESLLKKVKIRYVFLPYLLPVQRLLLALSESLYADQSYYDFLADPVSYLVDRGAEKIILVGSGENDGYEKRYESDEDFPPDGEFEVNSEDLNEESIQLPNDDRLERVIGESDPQLLASKYENILSIKSHHGMVSLKRNWVFRFFAPPTKRDLRIFESCVMHILPGTTKLDNATLKNILTNQADLDKLASCYKKTFKRLNDTSLLLYHGPTRKVTTLLCPSSFPFRKSANTKFYPCNGLFEQDVNYGWLLTGDVDFNRVSVALLKHFSHYLRSITHLLIPHHGSKGNWDSNIMGQVARPNNWFVSYGLGNWFRHPNRDVISDIVAAGNKVSLCNEAIRIDQYVFTWKL